MKKTLILFVPISLLIAERGFCQVPGAKLWEVTMPMPILSSPAIAPDGTIYIGSGDLTGSTSPGFLYSVSPQGTVNWGLKFDYVGGVRSSPSIGADGTIYVGTWNGDLRIVKPSGTYAKVVLGGYIGGSPAIGSDGTVYITSVSDTVNKLFALTPDGPLKWVFGMAPGSWDPGSIPSSSPAIGPDGTIYVGSTDKHLYAINPDGTTGWVVPLVSMTTSTVSVTYASPAIGLDGTIYIGANNGVFYAIAPTGSVKWKFQALAPVESSAAVGSDGTIYFGSIGSLGPDGRFYALAPDGTEKWSFPSVRPSASPALAADGSIYIPSFITGGGLYALSASGSNLWHFSESGYSFSSPTLGPDGTIYAATGTKLYALYGTNALMNSSWPMFRGNPKHTARSIQRGIQKPTILGDGTFAMNLNLETDLAYRVDYSTDLVAWAELTSFVSTNITKQFIDSAPTNSAKRYYRLGTGTP